ncbi:MAG: carbohydrate binding domain-containing protein [Deltaproteobacteria bacterium]|nr:carbohydrate binding domain-containing protein [Deltaproteobacteria bacterium]
MRAWFLLVAACSGGGHHAVVDGAADAAPDAGPIITHPTNVLGNGGFELGMVGWGEFVQPDGNGDYGFFLSTDAHGGTYALELRCVGPSCATDFNNRGFIITNPFHMPANQTYTLTFWAKCASGADAFFYTESAATPYLVQKITCTGDWTQNTVSFTALPTDRDGTFYFYNHSTGSLFLDDVVLAYADGPLPDHVLLHPGTRTVTTDGTRITVDGKPFYALGFFNVPYDQLDQVAAIHGANMVTTAGGQALVDVFNDGREPYPDRAYDLGLTVVPNLTETARLGVPDVFPRIMNAFGAHLANVTFYLADEPDQAFYKYSLIDPAVMQQEVAAAHTVSTLPLVADLQHAHYDPPSVDKPFEIAEDIYASEPYQEDASGITQTFTVFGAMTPRPVWIFDDNHADPSTVVPKAYYGTILGATGLAFFDWPGLDAANRAADAQAIDELSQLTDVIFADPATVTASGGVAVMARSYHGKTYVLAVNPTSATVQATFTAPGATAIDVMFEQRTLTGNGSFTDTFAGLSRHVYTY